MLTALLERNAPPQKPGEEVKLLYASQIAVAPPTFAIVSNRPDDVPEPISAISSTGSARRGRSPDRRCGSSSRRADRSADGGRCRGCSPRICSARCRRATWRGGSSGIDLREHGSRNLGATNLYRVLGWRYAIPVGLLDAAKGLVPVLLFAPRVSSSELFALVCGLTAVLGHAFSVFVGFKGGKGVATAAGVMLGLAPAPWRGGGGVGRARVLTGYV